MKNTFTLLLKAMLGLLASSCGFLNSGSDEIPVEGIPVQTESDGRWSMIQANGKMLFSDEFRSEPTMVVNGFFAVWENDSYTLYKADRKPEAVKKCDDLRSVGICMEEVIPLAHEDCRISIVGTDGETKAVLNPVGGHEIITSDIMFSDGRLIICTDAGKYGAVDKSGHVAVKPDYDRITRFNNGVALAMKDIGDDIRVFVIDKNGKALGRLKKGIQPVSAIFCDGLIAVCDDNSSYGFVNKKGEFTRMPRKVREIGEYTSKYFAFADDDGNWGLMEMDQEVLIRPRYEALSFLPGGKFLAKDGDDFLILDKNGEKEAAIHDYNELLTCSKDFPIIARDRSHYLILDASGTPICKEDFTDIGLNISPADYVASDYTPPSSSSSSSLNIFDRRAESGESAECPIDSVVVEPAGGGSPYNPSNFTISGKLGGKYAFTMRLSDENGYVSGDYWYGSGKNGTLAISGSSQGSGYTLVEYNNKGEQTGSWSFYISNDRSVAGSMVNFKGQEFSVSARVIN